MKHILIACLVFALCLAVGLFSLFYVRASGEETVALLERSIRQGRTTPQRRRRCSRQNRFGRAAKQFLEFFCTMRRSMRF